MTTRTFDECLGRYAADHNDNGTDKTTSHAYGPLYTNVFARLVRARAEQGRVVQRVLEIGVYSGAACLAFADFFEAATVDGLDIDLKQLKFGLDHPRIKYWEGDGTSASVARQLSEQRDGGKYDVILEDASHFPEHQVMALDAFAPILADGGVFVIEDIEGKYAGFLHDRLAEVAQRHGMKSMEWTDLRHVKGLSDDIVAVFWK